MMCACGHSLNEHNSEGECNVCECKVFRDKNQQIHEMDQGTAFVSDYLPTLWMRVYTNLMKEGFQEPKAFELLKVYILGSSGARIGPV